ncbi:translation initiation factor [Crocosphaera sp. UHCC 0190]|uniref:translation initiation factor n=1 Tax=Crocosphaera sp. UHCC 0190 TaxID=3110246 RepID=UPI002B1EDDCE|nr:translation initiation factor [Crocosphaera sp. UHCC 0190]MEA5509143.1 translation initiation factor [Crocosphaera sp. UHCC 0190]
MSSKSKQSKSIIYQEFGNASNSEALERTVRDVPPPQQNIRVQSTRSGRKGKTVTVITGFQHSPETLNKLLKQLKNQCGSGGTIKEGDLEIQGDHRQKLVQVLGDLGYKVKISGG